MGSGQPWAARGAELRHHVLELARRNGKLIPLHVELALEDARPLPVPRGEPLGDRDRLRVADLGRELTTPFRIRELPSLERELALGGGELVAHRGDGGLGLDHGIAKT